MHLWMRCGSLFCGRERGAGRGVWAVVAVLRASWAVAFLERAEAVVYSKFDNFYGRSLEIFNIESETTVISQFYGKNDVCVLASSNASLHSRNNCQILICHSAQKAATPPPSPYELQPAAKHRNHESVRDSARFGHAHSYW